MRSLIFNLFFVFSLATIQTTYALHLENNLELRAAAFFPSSHLFKEIYGNVGTNYQIEANTRFNDYHIPSYCLECIIIPETFVNFDWYTKKGRSVGFKDPTRISIADVSLGGKLSFDLCHSFSPYAGIGVSLSRIRLKNKSHCTHEEVSKLAWGGLVKSGIKYEINCDLFLDLFVDYLYQPVHFHKTEDIGGFKIGFGVGTKL